MKKILLFGTMLGMATTALAFGGVFSHGNKSTTYKGGVDAIGVHINGKDKANIDIRTCDSETEELVGTECLPKCPKGIERNTDNSCTVCANGNVYLSFNKGNECGTETPMNQTPCETGSDCGDGMGDTSCCDATTHTCKSGNYYYNEDTGEEGYTCVEANEKVCKSNKDCGSGEYCNLTSEGWDCDKPNTGTCTPIAEGDYTDATVTGLGSVRKSNGYMTWWAAENWCKAQGMRLATIEEFQVYKTTDENVVATEQLAEGADTWSYGCAEGKKCGSWDTSPYNAMWSGNTLNEEAGDADGLYKDRYSPVLISLREQFNRNHFWFWTASRSSNADSCEAFGVEAYYAGSRYRGDYNCYVVCVQN